MRELVHPDIEHSKGNKQNHSPAALRRMPQPFVFEASRTLKSRGTQMARRHPRSFGLMKARPHREDKHLYSFIIRPTLSQMWPEREAGPPFTFKISMLHVFCSSHGLAHFAALFIDPRA
ncbi:hypothetical protein OUZ56_033926 [Daphnia magna]|uniref:Uncharacterized protein n=1 Tax=Daphnia magna TaxID=35525 RepID=A0ABR0BBA7_9CRUS|nr:hypothetical protein OUZ56_033926 [Daphnia magna]